MSSTAKRSAGGPGTGRVQPAGCQAAPGHSAVRVCCRRRSITRLRQCRSSGRCAVPFPAACGPRRRRGHRWQRHPRVAGGRGEGAGGQRYQGLGLQGCRPEEVAELTASVRPGDYFDIEWRETGTLVPALARGWCGIIRGGKLEVSYRSHFGDLTLAQLPTLGMRRSGGAPNSALRAHDALIACPQAGRSLESAVPRAVRLAPRPR